ncbi:putative high-affinity glucose transporter of the major facilitator superfamily [Calocera viscosa TUFC12733]|uniref:Putative high-affinity glucose transporter of the major facilitator superfamily n=1 Tax=Calocera viscosa (strain TUFC12733) TaxID=1330018 RepID=A0A167HMM9_CALVF|nr:putative high-affinity glucose transporter of the major facilitator superfamily [Calocera viscosa TUFC12733]
MSRRSAFVNWRVYILAIVAYSGVFVFGFDTSLAGGVIALPGFENDFLGGQPASAQVLSLVVSVLQAGAFVGALSAAPISEFLGRRNSLVVASLIFVCGAAVQTAATNDIVWIYCGRAVSGVGVGAMTMLAPTYVAESAPANVRGRITGIFQVIVVLGVAISYWITYGVNLNIPVSSAQWRIPIAFQFVPVGIMLIFLPFCKESPRWLARKGRVEQSLLNLAWLRNTALTSTKLQDEFASILASVKHEREGRGNFRECFEKGNRIRFVIAFILFALQQFSGQNSVSYYAPEVFSSIGMPSTTSALLASGVYGIVKLLSTLAFLFIGIEQLGRRRSLVYGVAWMGIMFFIIGALLRTHPPGAQQEVSNWSIGMAVALYIYVLPYSFSIGPIPWVYCSEIFGNSIRHYGVAWAAATQWLFNFIITKITPTLEQRLSGGTLFFMFGSINLLTAVFCFFLPETKGVSLEEMDVIFGYVSREQRQRDVLRVATNLQHGALSGPDGGRHLFESRPGSASTYEGHRLDTLYEDPEVGGKEGEGEGAVAL